jgi:signal transduction histidine kinase
MVAARDTFIAVAAHELRNPMTPMIGLVELLLSSVRAGKSSPRQVEERLDRLRRVMGHYVKRAATLLDVSRLTSGQFTLESGPCDLCDVIRDVVATYAETAHHAGCKIGVDAPASLPGTLDRLAVEQVLDNLVSNAIKYGPRQPVHVCAEALGDRVRLQVRDHGPGISEVNRQRIFDRFERAVGRDDRRSGFGVGLWVVGQLVAAMEGAITIRDAEGGGSVFTVTLPLHQRTDHP